MERRSVAERLQQRVVWLLFIGFFCFTACSCNLYETQAGAGTDLRSAPSNAAETVALLLPEASGTVVYEGSGVTIDASNADQGYVMIRCEPSTMRLKARVSTEEQTYYYDLPEDGTYGVFPLQMGSDTYSLRVMEQVEGTLYAVRYGIVIDVFLQSEEIPFLYPNQYVWYDEFTAAVGKAFELAEGSESDEETVRRLYRFVVKNLQYDTEKAKTVQAGYVPDVDETLATGKGICFDYSVLLAVMLRAEGIPAKVMIGTVFPENVHHAWTRVYLDGEWIWMDATLDGTGHKETDYIPDREY